MYRHIKDYELRYTDVDVYDNMKLSALMSYLEESACLSADELGFGYKDIAPKNIGFIVANYYIELYRPIKLGETLTVHSWPLKPRQIIIMRDFELFVGKEKAGAATTRWCMVDTETFKMLPSSAFFGDDDKRNYNTERSLEFTGWKIPEISSNEILYSKTVSYSDYDHYFHVNNTKYADFLSDVFTPNELKNLSIKSVQITYVKQCKLGEKLDCIRERVDGGYIVEGRVDGELRVQMRILFNGL